MADEFTLTDEQVENWRTILISMPLPPFGGCIGAYALIAPREYIVKIAARLQEIAISQGIKKGKKHLIDSCGCPPEAWEPVEEQPTNIIRTRPRKKLLCR